MQRAPRIESLEKRQLLTGVTISVDDIEANEDDGTATFTVSLSQSSLSTITVDVDTSNGTATTTGSDYTSKNLTLNFNPGQTSQTVDVTISDDSLKESDETFKLDLSNPTNATIADSQGLAFIVDNDATGLTKRVDSFQKTGGSELHAGHVSMSFAMPGGTELIYNTVGAGDPILAFETVQPDDSAVPDEIKAELTFNGTTGDAIYYDTTGLSAGDALRFVMQADASSLDSNAYDWELVLTETHGSDISKRTLSGTLPIVNTADSPFGEYWTLRGLDSVATTDDWATIVFAHGGAASYEHDDEGGGGDPPPPGGGGGAGGSGVGLVENTDGSWTYNYREGGTAEYDSSGVLQELIDRNENVTSFTYTSGLLTKITDEFDREITLSYSSGLLTEIEGFAGEETTFP